MKRIFLLGSVLMAAMTSLAADVQTSENQVTIRPDGGQAKVIRLEVMNGNHCEGQECEGRREEG